MYAIVGGTIFTIFYWMTYNHDKKQLLYNLKIKLCDIALILLIPMTVLII